MGAFLSRVLEWKTGPSVLSGLQVTLGIDKRRDPELAAGLEEASARARAGAGAGAGAGGEAAAGAGVGA